MSAVILLLSKVDGRRFLADYKETACVFAGAEENEKKIREVNEENEKGDIKT